MKASDSKLMPAEFVRLIESIWKLNRVHNSRELDLTMNHLKDFCRANLRGTPSIHEFAQGTEYNYWIIPPGWNLKAYKLTGPDGSILAHGDEHPLAVGTYSCSVDVSLSLEELTKKTVTRSDVPDAFVFDFRRMYRHWEKDWSISIPYNRLKTFKPGQYRVQIDVELTKSPMPVFEYHLQGRSDKTIFLAGHIDHPGMINDSVSGCIACLQTLQIIEQRFAETEYSYRVLLLPEIIGSAVYLQKYPELVDKAHFALCPNMTSHDAPLAFCRSKHGQSLLDYAMRLALKQSGRKHVEGPFHLYPDCGDEIAFDCLGYQIPSSTLSRIGEMFKFYHTSNDSLENFLQADWQARHQEFIGVLSDALSMLERNRSLRCSIRGMPCMSNPKLNLYLNSSNVSNVKIKEGLMLDLDGKSVDLRNFMEFFLDALNIDGVSLIDIAALGNVPFDFVASYASDCEAKGLLQSEVCSHQYGFDKISGTSLHLAGIV